MTTWDVVVVGGGPAGATAAAELAERGRSVLLLDRAGRTKPCGGAVPPQLMRDFDIPDSLLVNRVSTARIISPRRRNVDIPIDDGYVGMVDRDVFDEWLRNRAAERGAERREGRFRHLERHGHGSLEIHYTPAGDDRDALATVRTRMVVGADGALSAVARQAIPGADRVRHVFAYHEIIRSPANADQHFQPARCDVFYDDRLSPDFYAWIFPHGDTTSIGTGSMQRGFGLRGAVAELREQTGLADSETVRCEGAPIPVRQLPRWDNGRDVILAGDAAGVVAPASGEGIFYAMTGGRLAADAVDRALTTGRGSALARARRTFRRQHGQVFRVLGVMQNFWYANDGRRERFVSICADRDVQQLTFQGYMYKKLVRGRPMTHARIFFKNIGHLTGVVPL